MANIKSSKKDIKRSRVRASRNKSRVSEIKTLSKKMLALVDGGKKGEAQDLLKTIQSKLARAAGKGVFKKNTVSRRVAKLAKCVGVAAKSGK